MPRKPKHRPGVAFSSGTKGCALLIISLLLLVCNAARARADAAFLLEEPYGGFGSINPTGHAAVYLNHVCAASPTRLRPCHSDEAGVVISRYHKISGYDWLAIPLLPYLYAVERIEDVPASADAPLREQLRDAYRRKYLLHFAPDVVIKGEDAGKVPKGEWTQLVGSSYDRKIYGFQIETTQQEDEHFIAKFNDRRNVSHFNLFFRNCADFSRNLLNMYYPHAVRRNFLVDLGMTTPKQVARSLTKFAKRHPDLAFSTFVIPQVPGSIKRSHSTDGVLEALVKSKKYVVPLAGLHPELTAAMVVAYLTNGRFAMPRDAVQMMVPGEDAKTLAKLSSKQEKLPVSVDVHSRVDVDDQQLPLNDHGMNLERTQRERVASGFGGATE
jgi:hypothetical protein